MFRRMSVYGITIIGEKVKLHAVSLESRNGIECNANAIDRFDSHASCLRYSIVIA